MYCAIIGDIVSSKSVEDRTSVQKKLAEALNDINLKYQNSIASKFTITLGDEFQALLKDPYSLFSILDEIKYEMGEIKIRYGIGFGEITTEINPEIAIGADGPAYYFARNAISEIKDYEKKYEMPVSEIRLSLGSESANGEGADFCKPHFASLINSLLSQSSYIKSKWTKKQEIVINETEKGKAQAEIAKALKVNQSVVTRMLKAAGYYTYKSAIDSAQFALNGLWRQMNE